MSDRCCICFESANTVPIPCCNGVMHNACWNQWMMRNPTCPLCRRPQPVNNAPRSRINELNVYNIIEFENGPSQIVGEFGPSVGRLARNSRTHVARQALANAEAIFMRQEMRTMNRNAELRRERLELEMLQESNEILRNDNRSFHNEADRLRNLLRTSEFDIIQYGNQVASLNNTVQSMRRELRVWKVATVCLTVVTTVLFTELVRAMFD